MSSKRLLALVGVVAIFAAACGGSTATSAPGSQEPGTSAAARIADPLRPPGRVRISPTSRYFACIWPAEDPHSLDPAIAETSTDIAILHALNRGLLYFDQEQNIVPVLAEALPEVSEDGLTYTFKLRDAQYSNGDTIVADDLVFAWKRLIDPRTAAYYQAHHRGRRRRPGNPRPRRRTPRMPTSRRRSMRSVSRPRTTRRSSSSSTIRPATSSISPPCGASRPTRRSGSPARTPPRRATTSARAPSSSRAGSTSPRSCSSRTRTGMATSSRP